MQPLSRLGTADERHLPSMNVGETARSSEHSLMSSIPLEIARQPIRPHSYPPDSWQIRHAEQI